jgi:hypothetical protein
MSHACLHLLEQALLIGMQELEALGEGQTEQAAEREEERSRLTQQAIEISGDAPLEVLLEGFRQLCELQKRLTQAGNELRQSRQQEMTRARAESRRLAGYRQATAHALN